MINYVQQRIRKWVNNSLFQLRPAEPGEVFLKQRRVFIVPSRAGLAYSVTLIVLFIASINYNLNLGFALTFILGSCALIDMHLTFRNLAHLHLRGERASTVFAGEEAAFDLRIINRRKHDRYAIWLTFLAEDMYCEPQATDIAANDSSVVKLHLRTRQRGWLQAPRVRLMTHFPLGLLRAWSYWTPDLRALVYPFPEDDPPPLPIAASDSSDGDGPAGEEDFAGIRPYRPGDSMRHLAWRQIARIDTGGDQTLVAKLFEGGRASDICLDYAALPASLDIEARLSRMTRWVLMAEENGLPYAFRLGNLYLPSAVGPAHQAACLQALALHEGA